MGASEERYRLLVERSPYCIHEIGLDARLASMNAAGLTMMGVTDESEVIGLPYLEAVGEGDRERVAKLMDDAFTGKPSNFEFESSNGRIFASTFVPILTDEGRVARLMGLTHDITEQRTLEAQVRQTQKLESIGQLAGGIAHDFNNLLQVVMAELDTAEDAVAKGQSCMESLRGIREAAIRAADLTNRLLTVARREPLALEPSDLNELLAGQAAMAGRVLPSTIAVTFRGAEGLPNVMMNAAQIEEVVLGLCVNAHYAMPNGGELAIETRALPPSTADGAQQVEICVRDTGVGMPPEVMDRAFDPFFTTKGTEGTGLGLSVAYGIIQQHGGTISIESTPGRGTNVRIVLPATEREPDEIETSAVDVPSTGGETLLVAEDNEPVRRLVVDALAQAGYSVLTAADGEEAIAVLADNPDIRLALLDVVMPRKNGVEVCDVILEKYPHIRVLFTSGYSADTVSRAYLETHGLQVLRKPYAPAELIRTIATALATPLSTSS